MERLQVALVLFWTRYIAYVKCPFCLEIHPCSNISTKEGAGSIVARMQRCPDPEEDEEFRLVYPDETHAITAEYGWELDKTQRAFYAVNRNGRVYHSDAEWPRKRTLLKTPASSGADQLALLAQNLSLEPRNLIKTGREAPEDVNDRRRTYLNACHNNQLKRLQSQFATLGDDILTWTEDDGANGAVIAAGQEAGLDTIIFLHQKGVDLNEPDRYGRTALMEAALCGRYKTARYLIQQGVNIHAVDGNGMTALHLSSQLDRNHLEREDRMPNYREPQSANRNRRKIELYLKKLTAATTEAPSILGDAPRIFKKNGSGKMVLCRAIRVYDVPVDSYWKAIGELDRGPNYPVVAAMSGYTQRGWPNVLDNEIWSQKAFYLCNMWGHETTMEYASHVEKQLIAYYLERHIIFTPETHLQDLHLVAPPEDLSPVTITVNKPSMCEDCRKFVTIVREIMGPAWVLIVDTVGVQ